MAVTASAYNHTLKLFLNREVNFTGVKLELLNNTASFVATDTTKTAVDNAGAKEVSGNGWAVGGPTLNNVTVTTVTTNDAKLTADDVAVTPSGGSIGPARFGLIYDSVTSKPLALIDFGADQTAGDGTSFRVAWPAGGILSLTI